eukprot:2386424-Lingulodinium_polyedra.AAC.1
MKYNKTWFTPEPDAATTRNQCCITKASLQHQAPTAATSEGIYVVEQNNATIFVWLGQQHCC